MSAAKPRVSIGLPVYNGERYLKEAVDSILAQTFTEFELIISDNASTDATAEISQAYAARDPRIRYHRNAANLGAARNYNLAFEMAAAPYFKWAAHDDVCAPDFLQRCVEALDRDPGVVLAHPRTTHIDENGLAQGRDEIRLATAALRPSERFRDLILIDHWCFQVFGVMRTEVLARTPLIAAHAAADRTLLARLGLLGRFYEAPDYLFLRRKHPGQLTAVPNRLRHLHAAWYDPRRRGQITLPQWRLLREYLRAVLEIPLPASERLVCVQHLARWIRRHRRLLWRDLARAGRELVLPPHVRLAQHEETLTKSAPQ